GYRQMYNLQFEAAHRSFQEWEKSHPAEPLGPVSDAAAYLFSEFDRLRVLESELFVDKDSFGSRQALTPDAGVRESFEQALKYGQQLADRKLAQSPQDYDAMFAKVLRLGLHADYRALIEKKYAASLDEIKAGRELAQHLVAADPAYYDAYLAIGVENYLLSQKSAPLRWLLRMNGAQTDKQQGIRNLRLTAEKGHYLLPFARLLLAVAALRDGDTEQAAANLRYLAREFPSNRLYAEELAKIASHKKHAS
ncbi:MAG TPA: hypothetical protein VNH18_00090, partial [Bryobacteraceae bacterium]|nr:hypothetical protein [Bryobacteraceae bacterium]